MNTFLALLPVVCYAAMIYVNYKLLKEAQEAQKRMYEWNKTLANQVEVMRKALLEMNNHNAGNFEHIQEHLTKIYQVIGIGRN